MPECSKKRQVQNNRKGTFFNQKGISQTTISNSESHKKACDKSVSKLRVNAFVNTFGKLQNRFLNFLIFDLARGDRGKIRKSFLRVYGMIS